MSTAGVIVRLAAGGLWLLILAGVAGLDGGSTGAFLWFVPAAAVWVDLGDTDRRPARNGSARRAVVLRLLLRAALTAAARAAVSIRARGTAPYRSANGGSRREYRRSARCVSPLSKTTCAPCSTRWSRSAARWARAPEQAPSPAPLRADAPAAHDPCSRARPGAARGSPSRPAPPAAPSRCAATARSREGRRATRLRRAVRRAERSPGPAAS